MNNKLIIFQNDLQQNIIKLLQLINKKKKKS